MKFANLIVDFERESKRQRNVGDDIQIYAIEKLYEYMKVPKSEIIRIKHSEIFTYDGEYVVLPINYPFYGCYELLSKKIIPVYLGISILSGKVYESLRLKQFEPIGCRDNHTLNELYKYGVKAYLNGCMTITLPKREKLPKSGKVFFVDICDELKKFIPEYLLEKAEYTTHLFFQKYIDEDFSRDIYQKYIREASLVVSSRMHCIVPCLAAGIPVIYAAKEISFRSTWLENIIPLYSQETFHEINWNPDTVDIEAIKNRILENASERIMSTYNAYTKILNISEIFETNSKIKFVYEPLNTTFSYIDKNWKNKKSNSYIIWGATQTAEMIKEYIKNNYPTAIYIGMIDLFRETTPFGETTRKLDLLNQFEGTVFVAVEAANKMALEIFEEKGIHDYVLCWAKGDYKIV